MRILGIETSCDETGVAIYDDRKGLISNQLYSQQKIHQHYGGVVPELASRKHIQTIIPLIKKALKETKSTQKNIHAIAYTAGPGLVGSLLVGATIGCSLAFSWNIPSIAINHMEGHLLAPMLKKKYPKRPFIALLVSGGNTQLVYVTSIGKYEILGKTIDDSVGESFDKIAKLLGFQYPGGAQLSRIAKKGITGRFKFPLPMIHKKGFNFSFSGLKTFTTNMIYNNKCNNQINLQTSFDIACGFENAIIDTLLIKCKKALYYFKSKRLLISGGVSANQNLRTKGLKLMKEMNGEFFCPDYNFCTDNAAMIALTGMIRIKNQVKIENKTHEIIVKSKWPLDQLPPLRSLKLN